MSRRRTIDPARLRKLARAQEAMNQTLASEAAAARARSQAAVEDGEAIVAALNADSPLYDITLSVVPAALQRNAAERDTAERAADVASAQAARSRQRINAMDARAGDEERREATKRAAREMEEWLANAAHWPKQR